MASPFAAFSGRGQRGATPATSTTRGREAPAGRDAESQPQGTGNSRGRFNGNRGRGGSQSRGHGRGRGRGRGTGSSQPETAAESPSQTQATNSPFAQSNPQKLASNPFGGPKANPDWPSQNHPIALPTWFSKPIPVEDEEVLARYSARLEQAKLDRVKEKLKAIKDGKMADPEKQRSLEDAITPVGTCECMCPEYERLFRIGAKMVDKTEKYLHPDSYDLQNMETKMVKRFQRSSAGDAEQVPSDIRTPNALLRTTNYIIRNIVDGKEPLASIHKFVWDRTRSIRKDFSVQQLTKENDVKIAVTCFERIARFHIVSYHLLSSPANKENFEHHQELEQLNNTMLSLMYYYDDNRGKIHFPNEDEFRAYHIILSIHDQRPDLEARVSRWPASLLSSPRVQVALDLYAAACNTWEPQRSLDTSRTNAIAQNFYARFFNIIDSPSVSYLMACIAEIYFNDVRQTAIRDIWSGYWRPPSKVKKERKEEWSMKDLMKALRFDSEEQTLQFCEEQNMPLGDNIYGTYLNWDDGTTDSRMLFKQPSGHPYSESYVEIKRAGRSLVAVILGMTVKEAATMGMIEKSKLVLRNGTSLIPSIEEQDTMMESPASALPNSFQNALPATNVSLAAETPTATPSDSATPQPSNPFGKPFPTTNGSALGTQSASATPSTAPQPSNPFGKMFPATNGSVLNSGQSSTTATTQPTNPFQSAPTVTPPTSLFPEQTSAPTSNPLFSAKPPGFSAPTPPQNPFSFANPTASSTKTDEKQPEAAASSLFPSAGLFKPAEPATSASNPFASVSSSATPSLFPATTQAPAPPASSSLGFSALAPTANPFFPSTQPKDESAQEPPSQPVSLFQPVKPMFPSTSTNGFSTLDASAPKPASPFSFASPAVTEAAAPAQAASPFSFASPAAKETVEAPKAAAPFSFANPAATTKAPAPKPASSFNFASPGVAGSAPKPASPFSFASPAVTEAAAPAQAASPFSFASPAAKETVEAPKPVEAPKAAAPFSFASPAAKETVEAPKPVSAPKPVEAPKSASPFSFAKPAATTEVSAPKPAPFSFASPGVAESAPKPASLFSSSGPAKTTEGPAPKPASPFSFSNAAATTEDPAPKPTSLFNSSSTAATAETSAPKSDLSVFSNQPQRSTAPIQFSSSSKSKETPEAKESAPTPFKFPSAGTLEKPAAEQSSKSVFNSSESSNKKPAPEAEKTSKAPLQFPSPVPVKKQTPPTSVFSASTTQSEKPLFSASTSDSQAEQRFFSKPQAPLFSKPEVEKPSVESISTNQKPAPPKEAMEATQPSTRSTTISPPLNSSLSSRNSQSSNKRKLDFEDDPFASRTPQEKQASWDRLISRAEKQRARDKALSLEREQIKQRKKQLAEEKLRKRSFEQSGAEHSPHEPETKLLKVSDLVPKSQPQTAQNRTSIFDASTRPLPKLPCLERADGKLKRKSPSDDDIAIEAQRRRQREVDQDELLFSAARIAAEQLKNGPKIFENYSQPAHESLRPSYSPHRSLSASLSATPYSQSMSPPDLSSSTHGYKVAYAPDTPLGLGRTLSRTEERIRRTGAHGLAYVPLDFSKSQRKSSRGKNLFSQSR